MKLKLIRSESGQKSSNQRATKWLCARDYRFIHKIEQKTPKEDCLSFRHMKQKMNKSKKKKSKLAKRKDKETSTYWRKKADDAWSLFVRKRDRTCLIGCSPEGYTDPCSGNLEAAHLISRGVHKYRHDPMNGLALCSKHHKFSRVISYHTALFAFVEWLREYKPEQYKWWKENSRQITYEPINFKEKHDQLLELMKVNKILQ